MSLNEMTAGDLMSFLVASQTVQRSLAQISLLYGEVLKGLEAGASVFEVGVINSSKNERLRDGNLYVL